VHDATHRIGAVSVAGYRLGAAVPRHDQYRDLRVMERCTDDDVAVSDELARALIDSQFLSTQGWCWSRCPA
jgi:hypothetical protein